MPLTESQYQSKVLKKIERRFPGCMLIRADPSHRQGVPDWFLLYDHMWAALEIKASINSRIQPNQQHYITELNHMSFAAFIYPENEVEVLDALQQAFENSRRACVLEPQ